MKHRKLFIFILSSLLLLSHIFGQNKIEPPVQRTKLAYSPLTYEKLSGPWHFYWGKFLSYDQVNTTKPDCTVKLPSVWNNYDLPDEYHKIARWGKGSGTYHLLATNLTPNTTYSFRTYDLAATAIRITVNGEIIYQAGEPYEDWTKTKIDQRMEMATFKTDKKGNADILLHVSNKVYRNGGMWKTLTVGKESIEINKYVDTVNLYSILSGILCAVLIFAFFLFIIKKDKASLFLALFALSLLIRMISSDFPILKQFIAQIPYPVMLRLEYSALYLSPITYTTYLYYLDRAIFRKIKIRYTNICGCIFGAIANFCPIAVSNYFVMAMQIYLVSVIIMDLVALTIYLIKYKKFIGIFSLATVGAIMLCALNDILLSNQIGFRVFGSEFLPFSFVFFSVCQIIILAVTQVKSEKTVQDLYNFLSKTNRAYNRFVPKQFLELFNYTEISQLEIGDKISQDMMILAADIRNFTAISESLNEIQVFDLLNGYFERITPIVYKHGGIIEKFLGDGIVVFFSKDYESALNCAIEIQETMIKLRKDFAARGLPELKIGIGVHYGNILVGTAGDASRMSEIAMSSELGVLQHVESSTKRYNRSIVVTKEALTAAANQTRAQGRKFNFSGKKIEEAIGHELYYIYNENISKEL